MLGRQALRTKRRASRQSMIRALKEFRTDLHLSDLVQDDGYAERFFEKIGFPGIETLDANDYEFPNGGPIRVHDLNLPVPRDLRERYGFIYDGGTTEHVFNVPVALENLFHMLKPGGRLIGVHPLNGMPGHGMYQFSAELIYGFWVRRARCKVIAVRAYSQRSRFFERDIEDTATTGRRTKFRSPFMPFWSPPPGKLLLQYEVERLPSSQLADSIQQATYQAAWESA